MHATTKTISINGHTYLLRKMNAMEGAYLVVFLAGRLLPLIQDMKLRKSDNEEKAKGAEAAETPEAISPEDEAAGDGGGGFLLSLASVIGGLEKKDTDTLIQTCMRHIDVLLAAGPQPIMDDLGNWGVKEPDVAHDLLLCLRLCHAVLQHNLSDFFGERGLASLFQAPDMR